MNLSPEKQKIKQIGKGIIFEKGKRAHALLRFLQKKKNVTWDKKGQIKFEGNRILNSHITKLITHATTQDNSNPIGMIDFYNLLNELKVPEKLIKNNKGKDIMSNIKKNHNKWRPPGKIN